jgi:anti-sigma B factor antagonist
MELAVEKVGEVTIVVLPGDQLDAGNAKDFRRDVEPFLRDGAKVVFDLSELGFIDSSGLGAILGCLRQLTASQGDLKLCGMSKQVRSLFELVRMHRVFDIYGAREEAVRALQPK